MEPEIRQFADEAALIEHLRAADAPCPACGYSLRGLGGLTCPECGRRYKATDLGRRPRPAWVCVLLGGWGWGFCVLLVAATYLWEHALGDRTLGWYARFFEGRNGGALIPTGLGVLVLLWPVARVKARRAGAEWVLVCAWVLAAVQVLALLIVSLV